jgi:parallel beta-helix repeat protein
MDFDPKGLFYDLQGCGSGDYTYFRNIGSSYVFAPTYGLAAIGLTKSDSLNEERRYYTQLSQGFCLGDTLLDWQRFTGEYYMAIIGDPLLTLSNATWISEGNVPPNQPGVPTGGPPFIGDVGSSYSFTVVTSDPDGNRIWYMVDWGDGTTWVSALVDPNVEQSISHSWSESGVYRVRVRATDEDYANGAVGAMSGWSDPLVVTIANPEITVNPSNVRFQAEEGTPCIPQNLTIENYGVLPLEFTITKTFFEPEDYIRCTSLSITRDGSGAVDHDNNVYLVWVDTVGSIYEFTGYVLYRRWDSGTWGWSSNVVLDTLMCGDMYPYRTPSVAVDPAGNVHVVWTRYDGSICYRKWDDSARQWIPSLNQEPSCVGYGWMSSIATDSQGVVHMVWYYNGRVYYKNTVTWTGAGQIICTGSPYQPLLAVDASDNLHVVWRNGANRLYHKLWDATTQRWSAVQPVFNRSFSTVEEYALAADSTGNVHVVWLCKELGGTRNVYYSKWDGGTGEWTSDTDLELITSITYTNVNTGQRYVSMAIDSKDNVYLLWLDYNPEFYVKLFYKVRVALLDSWTETMTLDISAGSPLLLADHLGTIHLFSIVGLSGIFATRALSPGIDWLSMEPVSGVVTPGGNVEVALSVDTMGLAKGAYRIYLVIASNDVSDPVVRVPVNLTVLSSVPTAPQVCVSWWGDNYVNLSWINVTRTEDGFPLRDLAGFRVYRNVTGSWSAFEQVAEVAAPATLYNDTGLIPGLFYYYRVTAVDESGHESGYTVCEKLRRGDVSHDGKITLIDVVYLTNYLFICGPAPFPLAAGDATGDGTIEHPRVGVSDVVYLINYLFVQGPPPVYQELPDMLPRADAGLDQRAIVGTTTVVFDGSKSYDPDGTIVSYEWDFGDGSLHSFDKIATHTYANKGTYTVTLTVTDNLGGTDTDTCCVRVMPWVLHVPDDFDSIQTAIAIAFDGQTILVAPGTYSEPLDFLGKAVTVRSTGGPRVTVIDGGQVGSVVTFVNGEASSSVLDGFTLTDGNADYGSGIYCKGSSPTITNNILAYLQGSGGGIYGDGVSGMIVMNNSISSSSHGIYLYSSYETTITNNTFMSGGITIYGTTLYQWNTHTIENNTANSKPIYYYKNGKDVLVPSDAGQIILANCSNFTLQTLTITDVENGLQLAYSSYANLSMNTITTNNGYGIYLYKSSSSNTITENNITNNGYGIYLEGSSSNTITRNNVTYNSKGICLYGSSSTSAITENNITNNGYGIYLEGSSSNTITRNNVTYNSKGIYLEGSSSSNTITRNNVTYNSKGICLYGSSSTSAITENNITNNGYGIYLEGSSSNTITRNNVTYNSKGGIYIKASSSNTITRNNVTYNSKGIYLQYSSNNNRIYHNNLKNTNNAYDTCSNTWYNTTIHQGNYWSDYQEQNPDATDGNGDGCWDTPYNISGKTPPNQDLYPLVNPWTPPPDPFKGNGDNRGDDIPPITSGGYNQEQSPPVTEYPVISPDLTLAGFTVEQTSETTMQLTVTVKNTGEDTINLAFQVSFTACIEQDSSGENKSLNVSIGTVTIPSLGPSETVEAPIQWEIHLQQDATFIAYVDSAQVIEETNELNNTALITIALSLLKGSLTTTADVYKHLNEQYKTRSAEEITVLAQKALETGAHTNLIQYMETMQEITKLQQEVGKELDGQIAPKLLEEYQRTIEDLTMLIKKAFDDGIISWNETVSVVETQNHVCDIVCLTDYLFVGELAPGGCCEGRV